MEILKRILVIVMIVLLSFTSIELIGTRAALKALTKTNESLNVENMLLIKRIERLESKEQEEPKALTKAVGNFTISHFCSCSLCCGKSDGVTATGTIATAGRTIAVDPDVIPLGSTVLIDNVEYIAEDVGGAIDGERIDIFVSSHSEAIKRGRFERTVEYVPPIQR